MKKHLFLTQLLFIVLLAQQAYADTTLGKGHALACLRQLLPNMQESTFEVPNRSTIMHMFQDGWGGIYSDETRSGVLLIERNQVKVCKMDWSIGKINYFRLNDSAGKIWYSYEKAKAMPFREATGWTTSYKKPDCKNVTDETATKKFVKKIVADNLISQDPNPQQVVSEECRSIVSEKDLKDALDLKERNQKLQPKIEKAPSNGEEN